MHVTASYPATVAKVIVLAPYMEPTELDELQNHLDVCAKRLQGNPAMAAITDAAVCWYTERAIGAGTKGQGSKVQKTKSLSKREQRRKRTELCLEEETKSTKKPAMKTATDVISRVRWDASLEETHFTIGYLDRMLGVVEKPFSAFSWEDIPGASNALKMWGGHCLSKHRLIQGFMVGRCPWVPGLQGLACHSEKWGGQSICCPPLYKKWGGQDIASVDYNTLAIPKHRIQYFKYKHMKVWDKNERMDNVFGSTGGQMILEVIEAYEQEHGKSAARASVGRCPDDEEDCEYHSAPSDFEESSDDDDGITIDTGFDQENDDSFSHSTGTKQQDNSVWQLDDLHNQREGSATELTWKADDSYWGPKKRPTHFLAVRVTNPEVIAAVGRAHQTTLNLEPSYTDCVIPTTRIHVTVACLGLDTDEHVTNTIRALHNVKSELVQNWHPDQMVLNFCGIGNFFHSVLYTQVKDAGSRFSDFVHHIRASVSAEGVDIRDVFEFTPHMTLVKLKRRVGRETLFTRYLDQRLYQTFNGCDFGSQVVDNLYLCEMSEDRREDDFYISPAHITFP